MLHVYQKQKSHHLRVSMTGGRHERGNAIFIRHRHIGAFLEQQVDHAHVAGSAGLEKCIELLFYRQQTSITNDDWITPG